MEKLTSFGFSAEVQGDYRTGAARVQAETCKHIWCWIDTEDPEAEVRESLGVFHRTLSQAVSEVVERAHETRDPFVFLKMKFSTEEESGAKLDEFELRIERLETDCGRWRLTSFHQGDRRMVWHDEAGSAIAACMALIAQTTDVWLAMTAILDRRDVFADKRTSGYQKPPKDKPHGLRLSPNYN
jgi:hypothetical protein